jgi:cation diffusion facilitator family transporter
MTSPDSFPSTASAAPSAQTARTAPAEPSRHGGDGASGQTVHAGQQNGGHGGGHGAKTVLLALGANAGIALVKFVAAMATGSGAMFAEAIHSSADCANQLLLLLGLKSASRAPTAEHPMGFGRDLFVASFMVSVLLFTVGGVAAVWHGLGALAHPEPVSHGFWALGVLAIGAVLESISLWGCLKEIRREAGDVTLWRYFRDSRSSEVVVVLGEDCAALAGLLIAAIALSATLATGDPLWDAVGSIGVGVVLLLVAALLAVEMRALLIGQAADKATREGIEAFLLADSRVDRVSAFMTMQNGDDVMVALKARLAGADRMSADEAARVSDALQKAIHERWPQVRWIFLEMAAPDELS